MQHHIVKVKPVCPDGIPSTLTFVIPEHIVRRWVFFGANLEKNVELE